jgi:hypothetical protein
MRDKQVDPADALSGVARDAFDAIEAAAVVGAARRGLLELEQLRTEMPHAGPQIDAGLHDLLPRLTELAAKGDGKGLATELAALKLRAQAGAILPKPYTPTPDRPSAFGPAPKPRPLDGRSLSTSYPHLDSFGMPRPIKQG